MRDLFETSEASRIDLPDADLRLWPAFTSEAQADAWLGELLDEVAWAEERLTMFGREVLSPRLVAWYGDAGAEYTYSGVTHRPHAWTGTLKAIRKRVEAVADARFNSVLANLYRHGRDSMGWHSDDEKELGDRPVIASVSLGAERRFRLRHRKTKRTHGMDLPHGSLLLMAGETQRCWHHCLPKTQRDVGPRVNLTFRWVGS